MSVMVPEGVVAGQPLTVPSIMVLGVSGLKGLRG